MDPDIDLDQTPESLKKQATLKEMARRSQDRIRVYNPLLEDYTVLFDGIGFVIPNRNKDTGHGLGMAVVLFYVAENYRTQMIDKILTEKMDEAIRLENESRLAKGMLPMTKFIGGEELAFANGLRTDNIEARRRLIPVIWKGLAERYGTENRVESQSGKPKDDRPLDERLMDEVNLNQSPEVEEDFEELAKEIDTTSIKGLTPLTSDLESKDVFTLRKIAKEQGIETEKTSKKADLIAQISQK